jgi:hypothetical protein
VSDQNSLSPRGAIFFGALLVACGVLPILSGLRVVPMQPTDGTPGWIAVLLGAVFVLGGAAVINGYAIAAGTTADGDLPPNTPFGVRLVQYVLVLGVVGTMTVLFGWVAFGPGERQFSTSFETPFGSHHSSGSPISGRIAFGIGTILMVAFFIAMAIASIRRLRDARRSSRDT